MGHVKAGGSTNLGRDSRSQRLGIKLHAGQVAKPGMIIYRQRGTKIRPGKGVKKAGDDSIFAIIQGRVKYHPKMVRLFTGKLQRVTYVSVV